ncbi:MAG: Hsp20 family protein [Acidobacteria bacterium]|nr:Hsp20 family protein [Acidobacteriota bacterium]
MTILRTVSPRVIPATAATLEPFRLMRDFLRWDPLRDYDLGAPSAAFLPSFDVKESPDAYQFKADLPGILEADLEISLEGTRLTVAGKLAELRNGVLTLMVPKRPEVRPRKISVSLG